MPAQDMLLRALLLLSQLGGSAAASITVGETRVTALSQTLVRIEPKGPTGFFDDASFNVVGREGFGDGLPIKKLNASAAGTWLTTSAYNVFIPAPSPPAATCGQALPNTDAMSPRRKLPTPNNAVQCSSGAILTSLRHVHTPPTSVGRRFTIVQEWNVCCIAHSLLCHLRRRSTLHGLDRSRSGRLRGGRHQLLAASEHSWHNVQELPHIWARTRSEQPERRDRDGPSWQGALQWQEHLHERLAGRC